MPVAYKESAEKPAASSTSEKSGNPKDERRKWSQNFNISSAVVSYKDNVCSIVRKTYDREPTDNMEDLDVNAAMGGHIPEHHPSSSSASWSRQGSEYVLREEPSLVLSGTIFCEI